MDYGDGKLNGVYQFNTRYRKSQFCSYLDGIVNKCQGKDFDSYAGLMRDCLAEFYRVLKPGVRYFATTFLSSYFGALQAAEGGATGPSRQAFQYFGSVEQLRELLIDGGFDETKVFVEVVGPACVVIRCEK